MEAEQTQLPQYLPKSGFAITSLVLGIFSFIPLVGLFFALPAITFGFIAKSKIKYGRFSGKGMSTAGIVLGTLGILTTTALYGSLFYYGFVAEGGPFEQPKKELGMQILTHNAGSLELYKAKMGRYPENVEVLSNAEYQWIPNDYFLKPFHYEVSEDRLSYDLRSLGPDGQYGTEDDIFFPNK